MKKALPVLPTAVLGIALLAMTAIGLNIAAARSGIGGQRLDLTQHKVFTLSDGTRNILGDLDTPVTIRFYFTEGSRSLPRSAKLYANRVKDLLRQYDTVGGDKVNVEFIDVQPNTDAEDQAMLDGIRPQEISVSETVYFGLSVSSLDRTAVLAALDPGAETLLEYNLSRAITQVVNPEKPKLGILSGVPIVGNGMPPQFGGTQGWIIAQQLEMDYELVEIDFMTEEIPPDIAALLVIHPAGITPTTEFALDQYLLRGGRAAIFLDAFHFFNQPQQNPMMPAPPTASSSTLPNLLGAWGLAFESGLVVSDPAARFSQEGRVLTGVSSFAGDNLAKNDPIISQLPNVFMILPGGFTGDPAVGLAMEPLVRTGASTALFDGERARNWDQKLLTEANDSGIVFDMVVRLSGRFPTAFPEGKPGAKADEGDENATEDAEAAAKDNGFLKQAEKDGAVILFADVDMIADGGAFRSNPMIPQIVMPFNGNFPLLMNSLEQLTGNANLIGARSRPEGRRPFKVMEEMQAAAERAQREKFAELNKTEEELSQRISELQTSQGGQDGEMLLTPEMQQQIRDAIERRTEVRREIRELQKEMTREKDRLQARVVLANLLIVPALIAIIGLSVALYRRARTAAR